MEAQIVSLSSVSGQRGGGVFGTSAYSAAKAGIMGLTKALARELTPRGIRVNCVAPSMVDTDIAGDLLTPERKVELAKGTLVGRLATVEDVANCILFLASDKPRNCPTTCSGFRGDEDWFCCR